MRSNPCDVRTSRLGDVGNNQNSSKAPVGAVCPDKFRFEQLPGSRQPRLNRLKVTRTTWGNVA